MPTPLHDHSVPPYVPSDALNPEQPVLPYHLAQHRQLIEQQRRREQASQGVELSPIVSPRAQSRPPPPQSTGVGTDNIPLALRINTGLPQTPSDCLPSNQSRSDSESPSSPLMGSKRKAANGVAPDRPDSSSSSTGNQNGHTTNTMNSHMEMRRKHPSLDSQNSASQTAHLMSREGFSLDDEPPTTPRTPVSSNHSFWELPVQDRRNFLLLVLLYFLQGIPMGLATGSVPFLLKKHLSYGQIGVFSLASYPYSLKLLWSPIVDAVWSPKVGRRKSWILPIQMLSGFGMIWLGGRVSQMMKDAGANGGSGVWNFTWWWFFLVFMCATQDIAVDGWALTLLSPANLSYASTAQTVGLTAGQFLSFTVFLAFNTPDFVNRWFRTVPSDKIPLTLGAYITFWGWGYLVVTIGLAILKREERTRGRDGIHEVYKVMWQILKLKNIQTFIVVHLIAKIGFQANDAVTNLKLLDKGFGQENMALTVLIDFPFEIILGYQAGKWSSAYPPMHLWCWAFIGRLIAAIAAQFVVAVYPKDGVQTWYLLVVIAEHIFSTFTSTVMFVAGSAFHAKIADPNVGGTYMTLLATVSNLGGTFPRIFILELVDYFTVATCTTAPKSESTLQTPFSCVAIPDKDRCKAGGGICETIRDGYYITNIMCVIVGVVTFWAFIRPAALKLQSLPLRAWRTASYGSINS
ncbi:MAG: hypothetical protein M1833_003170 [Piccolia ochrophora]|nr:MAG: hypothetical protein M1833_003170 [Piccolia ochrophora]